MRIGRLDRAIESLPELHCRSGLGSIRSVRAVQITGPRRAEIIEVEIPTLKPGDVRVKLQKTCLCGSDIPYFGYDQQWLSDEGKRSPYGHITYEREKVYPLPVGLSLHECVGVVEESASDRFNEGDFVLGLPFHQYGFFEYLTLPENRVFSLPESPVSKEELLLAQPFGTLLYAWRKMPDVAGKTVVVLGQGPIGLMFNALLKQKGAAAVIGIDRLQYRLETGRVVGADHTINATETDVLEAVSELTGGVLADIVIEAIGHAELAINEAIELVRVDGVLFAFGVVDHDYRDHYALGKAFMKNMTIHHSVGAKDAGDFLEAARMIAEREVDLKPLLTHSLPFDEAQRAYELFVDRQDGSIKVVIDFEK